MPANAIKFRMLTIRPTKAGIRKFSDFASRWGKAHFYTDGLRLSISNTEKPELSDLWVLTTGGTVTAWEIEQMLYEELS